MNYNGGMDDSYVVEWTLTGETEIKAVTPEQAEGFLRHQLNFIFRNQGDTLVKKLKVNSAFPSNEK